MAKDDGGRGRDETGQGGVRRAAPRRQGEVRGTSRVGPTNSRMSVAPPSPPSGLVQYKHI